MEREIHRVLVKGVDVDSETRCRHYHSHQDVIAIKFPCCNTYYPCRECHDELARHEAEVWPASAFDTKAVLCGACGTELTVNAYMNANHRCPSCHYNFNPGCGTHYHLYFDIPIQEEEA